MQSITPNDTCRNPIPPPFFGPHTTGTITPETKETKHIKEMAR